MANEKRPSAKATAAKKKAKAPRKVNVEVQADLPEEDMEQRDEGFSDDSAGNSIGASSAPTQEEIEDRRANAPRGNQRDSQDYDNRSDYDEDERDQRFNSKPMAERPAVPSTAATPAADPKAAVARPKAGDDYCINVFFDRTSRQFVASVVEFPEVKASAPDRERAVKEAERKLENHVQEAKRRGGLFADAISVKTYPERLEVPVSQTLFRKLDQLSRHEKIGMDQLVAEMLSAGVEKRFEPPQKASGHQQPHQREREPHHGGGGGRHGNRDQHQHQHRDGNQRHQQGGGRDRDHRRGGGGHRQRDYNNTMENRESFLEYVRSLEKNGGYGRKK